MASEVHQQIEAAFDFRGDVTLTLTDGSQLIGFVGNREFEPHPSLGSEPFVEVYLPTQRRQEASEPKRILISSIASVALTGTDHAAPSAE